MKENKRKQFSVGEFISNELTPVETRDGRPVEIYTTNRSDEYSVVGGIKNAVIKFWRSDGTSNEDYTYDELDTDLFFTPKKTTRRMTHQELSWWLREHQEEHREFRFKGDISVFSTYTYRESSRNCPCEEGILIRSNGGEWEEPEIEIEEKNDKRD